MHEHQINTNNDRNGVFESTILPICTIFIIGRPQDIFPFIGKLYPGYLIFIILSLSILIKLKIDYNQRILNNKIAKTAFMYFSLMYLSIIWAEIQSISYEFLITFINTILYFYCFCKYPFTKHAIMRQLGALVIIVLFYSILAIMKKDEMERVFVGNMYDPNDIALIFVSSLPLIYLLMNMERKIVNKIIPIITMIIAIISIILTKSRGGLLGLIVMFISILLMKMDLNKVRFNLTKILTLCAILLIFMIASSNAYWERMRTITEGSDQGSGRVSLWLRALEMTQEKMFLGVGIKNFTSSYGYRLKYKRFRNTPSRDEWTPNAWATAHNSYILVAAELGLIGVILFIATLINCMISLRRVRVISIRDGDNTVYTASGLFILALISFIVCATFLSFAYQNYLYFLIGMIIAFSSYAENNQKVV